MTTVPKSAINGSSDPLDRGGPGGQKGDFPGVFDRNRESRRRNVRASTLSGHRDRSSSGGRIVRIGTPKSLQAVRQRSIRVESSLFR